jgi:hypothetical protein
MNGKVISQAAFISGATFNEFLIREHQKSISSAMKIKEESKKRVGRA